MEFEVIYDVNEAGYQQWRIPASGLIFVAIGLGVILYRRRNPSPARSVLADGLPYWFTGFAAFWVIVAFLGTFMEYRALSRALRSGRFETVEGRVTGYMPAPLTGHKAERFSVNDRNYELASGTAAFHKTQAEGGPVREGMVVRIADVGGKIARLEIAR